MIAHKDEERLTETVTPPVSLCYMENTPAEMAGSALGTWLPSYSDLAGLSRGMAGDASKT